MQGYSFHSFAILKSGTRGVSWGNVPPVWTSEELLVASVLPQYIGYVNFNTFLTELGKKLILPIYSENSRANTRSR